jgi:hypothetical protein
VSDLLRYNPMIYNSAAEKTVFALPLPILSWDRVKAFTNNLVPIVGADGALCTFQRKAPLTFSIQGEIHGWPEAPYTPDQKPTREALEATIADFEAAVAGSFWLYRFATLRWEDCVCNQLTISPMRPDFSAVYRLEVTCLSATTVVCDDEGYESPYGTALQGRA